MEPSKSQPIACRSTFPCTMSQAGHPEQRGYMKDVRSRSSRWSTDRPSP
jgi:hypothetical protein